MNYFSVSDRYAAGIKRMIETLGRKPAGVEAVKGQCVGPLTFGLTVKDESGKAVFHDPQLRDVTIKHIILKSAWQIKTLADATGLGVMLFLDEPYLSAYGSAFTALSRDEAETTIKETVSGIKTAVAPLEALIGIHCCGNTDWSLLLDSDIDILSFDAYEFFDNLLLYSDKVGAFLSRGGRLAWGIVPTAEDALMKESAGSLITRLTDATGRLAAKGVDLSKVRDSFIFTPACGLGSRSEKAAETALRLASEIAYLAAEAFK
jgi:methionine synthase II (cobalamin-independent)